MLRDSCNRADQDAGLAAAALLVRLIAKLLFATAPLDPPTFAAEPILIGAVALAASHMPPPTAADLGGVVGGPLRSSSMLAIFSGLSEREFEWVSTSQ
jgi:hypothetical protein